MTDPAEYPPLTLYTKPKCPGCNLVKGLLDKDEVDYEVVDIEANAEAYTYVTQVLGAATVPVLVADSSTPIIGFKPDKIRALLKALKPKEATDA